LTNSLSQRLALLFSLLTVVELLSLVALAPLDAAVAQWIEAHRSCEFDHIMFLVEDHPLTLLFILGGLTLVVLLYLGRWREASHLLLIVLAGSFFCELLKTGFERARPSVLPSLTVGNSFPSGHVTTALYIAGAIGSVLWRSSWSNSCKIIGMSVLGLLASMTAWQRLYLGHHWCTDVIGSTLLVGRGCVSSAPSAFVFFSQRTVLTCVGAFASYAMFYFFPTLRLSLPSHLLRQENRL
jgi:membrane-associated phospholipid phosphatase